MRTSIYLRSWLIAFLLMISFNVFSQQPDSSFHIYLCFGQSNMAGAGKIQAQDQTVDSRFKLLSSFDCSEIGRTKGNWAPALPSLCFCSGGLSPADYFGRTMVSALPSNIKIGVVVVAIPGCKIELFDKDSYQAYLADTTLPQWFRNYVDMYGGDPYQFLVDMAKLAQKDGIIKGVLLHQGESNTGDPQWPSKVKKIYNRLLNDLSLNANDVPLLAGELVSTPQACCSSMNPIIDILPDTIPTSHVISSKGCTDTTDHTHFNSEGNRELGRRYATTMLKVVYNICDSTTTTPWYKINSGALVQGDSILVSHGTTVVLSPQPSNGLGTWSWTDAGTSGSSREQTINTSTQGTYQALVTYTNECNKPSRMTYKIIVCDSAATQARYSVDSSAWVESASVVVRKGSNLVLSPLPDNGTGTWNWTGTKTSGNSREQTVNTNTVGTFAAKATYTNDCGAISHMSMSIRVCDSTNIVSYYLYNNSYTIQADTVKVKAGTPVKLSPYPPIGGSWSWSGAGLSGTSREQIVDTSIPGTYYAYVVYTNSCGIISRKTIPIIISPLTGTNPDLSENSFELFPNPATDEIKIRTSGNFVLQKYIITNNLGQTVTSGVIKSVAPEYPISLDKLEAGTYNIQLISNKGTVNKRFVKMKQ